MRENHILKKQQENERTGQRQKPNEIITIIQKTKEYAESTMANNRKIDRFKRPTAVMFNQEYGKVEVSDWVETIKHKRNQRYYTLMNR